MFLGFQKLGLKINQNTSELFNGVPSTTFGSGLLKNTFDKAYAWYDANSCLIDESGYVSQINDLVGINHAVQSVQANKPLQVSGELNGYSILRFSGNQWLKKQFPVILLQAISVFVVWKKSAASPLVQAAYDNYSSRFFYNIHRHGQIEIYAGAILSYSKATPFNYLLNSNVYNGTSSEIFENGVSQVSGNAGTSTMNGITIGALYDNGSQLNGDIAEIIIFNEDLEESERQTVEGYLINKYVL